MCSILGLIDTGLEKIPGALIESMQDVMLARGPDGSGNFIEGSVAMAMRRLAIIDLEQGWQPLTSQDGQIIAFQNGEIYNYQKLKKELEQQGFIFKTNSDTEILAHGFAQWGIEGLLEKIDGMYAIAIFDRRTRELHLARDRFGEKPLFYCYTEGRFAYSSNMLALAALPWVNNEIDPLSLDRYLALHFVPGDRTILKDIKRVLPGERLCIAVDNPVPQRFRYYQIPIHKQHSVSDEELANQMEKAVVSRLIADVPVGVFLSGGLDSSIVAAIAARHNPQIDTFSMGFSSKDHDESIYAQQVSQAIGSNHHHFMFDENSFAQLLPQVAAALDEPIGDQAMLPLYWLCKEAKQHVTVVLSGEGADEIFAGYSYYNRFACKKSWKNSFKALLARSADTSESYQSLVHNSLPITPSGFPLLSDAAQREQLLGRSCSEMDQWEHDLLSWLDSGVNPLQKASSADMATWLPDNLLVKYDRMAMAHSLEGRAPFLQPQLVEIGLNLPERERMSKEISKIALRRVAGRWLPKEIMQRRKQGFVLPMANWLKQWFETHGGVDTYFASIHFPGLDIKQVCQMVKVDLQQGIIRERFIFALILLIEWHRKFELRLSVLRDDYMRFL
ncbi:MAG: asparagine synthase (glutamine-hydrolyzing) [Nostoc sp.]|uniref:asparagine synthase (glutamine-hydrolyzing) n=1 Tax=Nostoc sp. TaxID=1180 RepID=UPI002FF6190C